MDYTQLTDDELRQRVLELMGYGVVNNGSGYLIRRNGFITHMLYASTTEAEAWKYAPDPLTDANVYMALVDEMASLYYDVTLDICVLICSVLASKDKDNEYEANNARLSRAICEVYCQVKEQK